MCGINSLLLFCFLFFFTVRAQFGTRTPLFIFPPPLNFLDARYHGSIISSIPPNPPITFFYNGTIAMQKTANSVKAKFNTTSLPNSPIPLVDLAWQFSNSTSGETVEVEPDRTMCFRDPLPVNGSDSLHCGAWSSESAGGDVNQWTLECEYFMNRFVHLVLMDGETPVMLQWLLTGGNSTIDLTMAFLGVTGKPPADDQFVLPPYCSNLNSMEGHEQDKRLNFASTKRQKSVFGPMSKLLKVNNVNKLM